LTFPKDSTLNSKKPVENTQIHHQNGMKQIRRKKKKKELEERQKKARGSAIIRLLASGLGFRRKMFQLFSLLKKSA